MNQREHERYLVEFPARFAGDCEGVGIVYNLGMGGCKVVTDRPLIVGAMLAPISMCLIRHSRSPFGWRPYVGRSSTNSEWNF